MDTLNKPFVDTIIVVVVLLSVISLTFDSPANSDKMESSLFIIEVLFAIFFILEMVAKLYALGFRVENFFLLLNVQFFHDICCV